MNFKRAFFMLVVLFTLFAAMAVRLAYISLGLSAIQSADFDAHITVVVDSQRGTIFDRNMMPLTNDKCVYKAVLIPEPEVVAAVYDYFSFDRAEEIVKMLKEEKPIVVEVSEDFLCKNAFKFYCRETEKRAAIHTLGYLDSDKNGVCGIEAAFESVLKNEEETYVRFECDALGRPINTDQAEVGLSSWQYNMGVVTTIDKRIQNICDSSSVQKGAVVVLDCKTGEILGMSSFPAFSNDNMEQALENPNDPFINRSLMRYNVGSIFKIVVLASALENGIDLESYNCTGTIDVGQKFNCHSKLGHKTIDYSQAFVDSCNTYFINLAQKIGLEKIVGTATRFEINKSIHLCDGVESLIGLLPDLSLSQSAAVVANTGIGQGDVMMTPLQIAAITAAVANKGIYNQPTLIKGVIEKEKGFDFATKSEPKRVVLEKTAQTIKDLMKKTVDSGTGVLAKPEKYAAAGKTATAETGIKNEKKEFVYQAWFTGFYPVDDPKYAITVLCEDKESGGSDAAPIFKKICDAIENIR